MLYPILTRFFLQIFLFRTLFYSIFAENQFSPFHYLSIVNLNKLMKTKIDSILNKYLPYYKGPVEVITGSGSNRIYIRLRDDEHGNFIAVYGEDIKENNTFVYLAKRLRELQLPVPSIYGQLSDDGHFYLQEDLGRSSLYDALANGRKTGIYSEAERVLVRRAIELLVKVHNNCILSEDYYPEDGISVLSEKEYLGLSFDKDLPHFYPYDWFGEEEMSHDFNYFTDNFLNVVLPDYDVHKYHYELEGIINSFESSEPGITEVYCEPCTLLYRDYQPRNIIMGDDGELHLIDFQTGHFGPPFYDVVSFLWQSSARYPDDLRNEMLKLYYDLMSSSGYWSEEFTYDLFLNQIRFFRLLRHLQVLGAYGFRGYKEGKAYFIQSIPYAIENLRDWLSGVTEIEKELIPYTLTLLQRICQLPQFNPEIEKNKLVVRVNSFSFKKGIPTDSSGNGGGYVFDCRGMNNPGRYEQYKQKTGRDESVIRFLEEDGDVYPFLNSIYKLADAHVRNYLKRGFTDLMFSFGCTGGQHRSVYCADHLAKHLNSCFGIKVEVNHIEQGIKETLEIKN